MPKRPRIEFGNRFFHVLTHTVRVFAQHGVIVSVGSFGTLKNVRERIELANSRRCPVIQIQYRYLSSNVEQHRLGNPATSSTRTERINPVCAVGALVAQA